MEKEQFFKVLQKYSDFLEIGNINRLTDEDGKDASRLGLTEIKNHLRYMINMATNHMQNGKTAKAMRWLGFIQGVLWTRLRYPLAQLKSDNRKEQKDDTE